MYSLWNERLRAFAHKDSKGEHDGLTCPTVFDAAEFDTYGEAAEFSQNFSDEWNIV